MTPEKSFSKWTSGMFLSLRHAISVRHSNVTFRKAGTGKNFCIRTGIKSVSKMYPKAIQFRNLSRVCRVVSRSEGFWDEDMTNWHNWKTRENSLWKLLRNSWAFACVICQLEKSNTSSLINLKITIVFSHKDSFFWLALTISGIKVSQFFGHSCLMIYKKKKICQILKFVKEKLNTWTKIKSSLSRKSFCVRIMLSSELIFITEVTIKFLIASHYIPKKIWLINLQNLR